MKRKRRCKTCKQAMKGHKKSRCQTEQTLELPNGAVYTGTIYNGEPSGRGRLSSEGLVYEGEFINGKKHGYGKEKDTGTNGYSYSGYWSQNMFHGHGNLIKSDESIYEGSFHSGTFHGFGKLIKNALTYEGQFYHGVYHGEGSLTDADNGVYEGQFYFGLQHGEGTYTESNGNLYSGQWHKGKRHGKGIYTSEDGTYTGQWSRDVKSGHGTWVSKIYGEYIGQWKKGLRHNKGTQTYINGSVYTGGWSKGKKTGHGVQTWPDGAMYKGFWLSDDFHGRGLLTETDGHTFEGQWVSGMREGVFVEKRHDGSISKGPWQNDLRHGTFRVGDKRHLYIWGRLTEFQTKKKARSAVIRTLREKDFLTSECILNFYPSLISWALLFKYDIQGTCLSIVPKQKIHHWVQRYAWTIFKKKRYLFLERLVGCCDPGYLSYCEEHCSELYDKLTGDFVANPWIVHNVSYSESTKKKLLEGLHLGELGRCPPRNPFTRQNLTKTSGIYLSCLPTTRAREIYARFMKGVHKKPQIREMAYSFDLEDFETSLKNARDARDIHTIRHLLKQRDMFIEQQRSAEDDV